MLEGRNILCYARTSWYANYAKTIVELMKVFSEHNQVLYVDYQFTFKDFLSRLLGKGEKPGWQRMLGLKSRVEKFEHAQGGCLYLLTLPPVLPLNFLPHGLLYLKLQKLNTWWVNRTIKKYLKSLGLTKDLIHINSFNPDFGRFSIQEFNERTSIYHCYDQIAAAQWAAKHGAENEKALLPKVKATVFTAQGLLEQKKQFTPQSFLVKNGVNYHLFHQGFKEAANTQTVAYIGSIDFRTNFNLLEHVIASCPNLEFHFVGPVKEQAHQNRLKAYPNVKLLGSRTAEDLPEFLAGCAAGIIPFEMNEFTKGVYPLKVNEYLAAGLPVVSTRFGNLQDFEQIIDLVHSKEQFTSSLKKAIAADSPQKRHQRAAFAKANSWHGRVKEFSKIIEQLEQKV